MNSWKNLSELPIPVPVRVPDGISRSWEVFTYTVSEEESKFDLLRASIKGSRRYTPAGTYRGLRCGGSIIMSNTPNEIRDLNKFFIRAKGICLINGLGLGIALDTILNKVDENNPQEFAVKEIFVVEKSEDVLNLVGPTFVEDKRVRLIHDDALLLKSLLGSIWMRYGMIFGGTFVRII